MEVFTMNTMKELLDRTSLKALGSFVMDSEAPLEELLGEDVSPEELMRRFADDLHLAIRNGGAQAENRARQALEGAWDAAWRNGCFAGMKVGARIVLALTDGGEIVC